MTRNQAIAMVPCSWWRPGGGAYGGHRLTTKDSRNIRDGTPVD
jgi:hypothetical protein